MDVKMVGAPVVKVMYLLLSLCSIFPFFPKQLFFMLLCLKIDLVTPTTPITKAMAHEFRLELWTFREELDIVAVKYSVEQK